VRVPGTGIRCDATGCVDFTFLSSASLGTRARRVLASRETALLSGLEPGSPGCVCPVPGQRFVLGDLALTLVETGYCPGASMLLVERPDGARTLYAARLPADPGRLPEVPACGTLLLDPGWSDPSAARDPVRDGGEDLVAWTRQRSGEHPALLVDSPALLAPLAALLDASGLISRASRAVRARARILADLGLEMGPLLADGGRRGVLVRSSGGRTPRTPAAAVVDTGDAAPALASPDRVFRLPVAAPARAYVTLVERCGAEVVHTGPSLADLPALAAEASLSGIRWVGGERQESLPPMPS